MDLENGVHEGKLNTLAGGSMLPVHLRSIPGKDTIIAPCGMTLDTNGE